MSNMRKHVKSCWGKDVLNMILDAKNLEAAWVGVNAHTGNGSIAVAFEHKGKGQVTYSHRQHTKAETK